MLLTITTTHQPATDLGYLLHKNPARAQSEAFPFGRAHVFYPEASAARCTAALVLDVELNTLRARVFARPLSTPLMTRLLCTPFVHAFRARLSCTPFSARL